VELDGSESLGAVRYEWKAVGMNNVTNSNLYISDIHKGTYTITLRVFDSDGNSDETSVTIKVAKSSNLIETPLSITPTPRPTHRPTVTPRPTPRPTVTPRPTHRPTVTPRPTPRPTVTPRPTHRPTVTPRPTQTSVSGANVLWIKPSKSACENGGGRYTYDNECLADWQNANSICQFIGGSLPTIEMWNAVITDCVGDVDEYEDYNNKSYQSCYKGFTSSSIGYWSSTTDASASSSDVWDVHPEGGSKAGESYVRCVRGR